MFEGAYCGGSQLPQLSQCGCKRSRGGPRLLAVHPQSVACEMRAAWHTQPHPPPRVCLSLGSVSQGSCIGSWGVVSRRRVWRRMPSVLLAHPVTNAIRVRDGSPPSACLVCYMRCGCNTHLAQAVAVMCMTSLASRLSARDPVSGSSSVCVRHGRWGVSGAEAVTEEQRAKASSQSSAPRICSPSA